MLKNKAKYKEYYPRNCRKQEDLILNLKKYYKHLKCNQKKEIYNYKVKLNY